MNPAVLDTAWQRLMLMAIDAGIITADHATASTTSSAAASPTPKAPAPTSRRALATAAPT